MSTNAAKLDQMDTEVETIIKNGINISMDATRLQVEEHAAAAEAAFSSNQADLVRAAGKRMEAENAGFRKCTPEEAAALLSKEPVSIYKTRDGRLWILRAWTFSAIVAFWTSLVSVSGERNGLLTHRASMWEPLVLAYWRPALWPLAPSRLL